MNILIIEDEEQAYTRLKKIILEVLPTATVVGIVMSVRSAVEWFHKNDMPALIFMDINLADGDSFEIFSHTRITAPIIFTTEYEEYAIKAFKVNSVAYLLNP
jgi:two-component system LytT family response regulator